MFFTCRLYLRSYRLSYNNQGFCKKLLEVKEVVIVFRFEGAQLRTEADFEVEEVYIALQKGSRISMLARGHFVKPEVGCAFWQVFVVRILLLNHPRYFQSDLPHSHPHTSSLWLPHTSECPEVLSAQAHTPS